MRLAAVLLVVTTLFGQTVLDPYRWLENGSSPRTQAWIAAQNASAERVIDSYSGRERIAARVEALSRTGEQRYAPQLAGGTLFYLRETPPAPQPVLVAQTWPSGTPHVVVDPAAYGPNVSIDFVWPSPSGRLVALATSSGGSEAATIRVVSAGGKRYSEALGPAGGGTTAPCLAWDADERGFTYGRLPDDGSQFGMQLYHHVIGTARRSDALALAAVSPVAEFALVTSDRARRAAALVQFGDGSPYRVYFRNGLRWEAAVGPQAGIIGGSYAAGNLLVAATSGTPRGRIAAVDIDGTLRTIVPESADWAYHDISPIAGGFLVTESWGPKWRLVHYAADGRAIRTVALPANGIAFDGIASSASRSRGLVAYSGWTIPLRWVTYDARSGTLVPVYAMRAPSDEYANVLVRSVVATSADGTQVPLTVLALKTTPGLRSSRGSSDPRSPGSSSAACTPSPIFAAAANSAKIGTGRGC
jgi:prolyl oligopeptidase